MELEDLYVRCVGSFERSQAIGVADLGERLVRLGGRDLLHARSVVCVTSCLEGLVERSSWPVDAPY